MNIEKYMQDLIVRVRYGLAAVWLAGDWDYDHHTVCELKMYCHIRDQLWMLEFLGDIRRGRTSQDLYVDSEWQRQVGS